MVEPGTIEHDGHVDQAALDGVGQRDVSIESKSHPPVGQPVAQYGRESRQQHVGAVFGRPDHHQPTVGGPQMGKRVVVCGENHAGVPQHTLPEIGKHHPPTGAFDDGSADNGLHFAPTPPAIPRRPTCLAGRG